MAIRKSGAGGAKRAGGVRKPQGEPKTSEEKLRRMGLPQTVNVDGQDLKLDGDKHWDRGMPGPSDQGDPTVVVQNGRGFFIQPGQLDEVRTDGLDNAHADQSKYEGERGGVNKAVGNKAGPRETYDERIARNLEAYDAAGGDPAAIPGAAERGFNPAAFERSSPPMQQRIEACLIAGIPLDDNGFPPDPGVLRGAEALGFERAIELLGGGIDERIYARFSQLESMGRDPSVLPDAFDLGFNRVRFNASDWDMQSRISACLVAGVPLDDVGLAPDPLDLAGAERLSFLLAAELLGYEL